MSQTHQIKTCCQNDKAYTVTYLKDNNEETFKVCISHFNEEIRSKSYSDRIIKPYQRNVIKIICEYCSENVTETRGCKKCNTVPGNSQERKS